MRIKDMNLDGYNQGKHRENHSLSLDHVYKKSALFTHDYGYNYVFFTLLMMMMRHKGEIGHLQHLYISDELMNCCFRFFNNIFDIFKVVIPNNKFYYDWKEHGVENIPRKWRQIFLDSINKGYDHDKM